MFESFETLRIQTAGTHVHLRVGGAGPPLLLLHGFPQTHVTWHRVAPALAQHFTVVVPDLRGQGDSSAPPSDSQHTPYTKRALAQDAVELMALLGHARFRVVGHDRGARVAYRLALDHPACVERLALLDIIPTAEMWRRMDRHFASANYHWLLLAQPELPERLLAAAPDAFLDWTWSAWAARPEALTPEARAEYARCFRRPGSQHAACEDYRAGAEADLAHDEADLAAGRRIPCPLLALWGAASAVPYDPLEVWRHWATDVRGRGLDCGHFLQEEAPEALLQELLPFLQG
uniref:Hydrolase alpha/beta fold family n=1 Tax=Simulacricoccus ruber TaxID=2303410 RepID=A0A3Q8I8N0_9BACT|nr:hydrolase alpha/beta fold family [Simulacricoccus ruber]